MLCFASYKQIHPHWFTCITNKVSILSSFANDTFFVEYNNNIASGTVLQLICFVVCFRLFTGCRLHKSLLTLSIQISSHKYADEQPGTFNKNQFSIRYTASVFKYSFYFIFFHQNFCLTANNQTFQFHHPDQDEICSFIGWSFRD